MQYLTKSDLLKALKRAHQKSVARGGPAIGYTYKTLMEYEDAGIIPRGGSDVQTAKGDRFYTEQDIKDIVRKVEDYKNGK